jgi:hypothetical protein
MLSGRLKYIIKKHMCVGLWVAVKEACPRISQGRGEASTVQDWPVELKHGTRVDGNSHPCIKGHHPSEEE